MKKALVIGIDDYCGDAALHCCHKDAQELGKLLAKNEDGSPNFGVQGPEHSSCNLSELVGSVKKCFVGESDIALFYFSGHGYTDGKDTYILSSDYGSGQLPAQCGLKLEDLIKYANDSKAKNRIVILDCCHAGSAGEVGLFGQSITALKPGTTILSACREYESAVEVPALGHGVFTELLLDALKGSAADLCGNITPGSVYAYIDKALGPWQQRPVFKTNVDRFISLRQTKAPIEGQVLRQITEFFKDPHAKCHLDPSYEFTNDPNLKHEVCEPYATEEHVKVLKALQKMERVGLVRPSCGEAHMYFAAMHSTGCELSALGRQYWRLVEKGHI